MLRAQINELNAALMMANAKADRALAEERQRADRLNEQVKALTAESCGQRSRQRLPLAELNGRRWAGTPSAPTPRRCAPPSTS